VGGVIWAYRFVIARVELFLRLNSLFFYCASTQEMTQPSNDTMNATTPNMSDVSNSSDVHSNVSSVFNQHQNEIQRRSHLSSDGINNDVFPRVDDSSADLDFQDPEQQFIVFSLSHKEFAPVATDPTNPGVRIYGSFETNEEAIEHAKSLMIQDPKTSFMVNKTHEWVAAVSGPSRLESSASVIQRVLVNHQATREKNHAEFIENVERKEIVNAPETSTDVSDVSDKTSAPDLSSEKTTRHTKKLINLGRVPDQNICVSTFIRDNTDDCEFIFKVYGFVESEAIAHKWVSNVIGDKVRDMDIDVVAAGQWVFPQSMTCKNTRKEIYRSQELDSIMKEHRAQPKRVEEFKREYEE
jgi:hypothetical protein